MRNAPTGQTSRRIFTHDGSNDAVFMDSSSKDCRTRRSCWSQKKDCAQIVETCLCRHRSHEKVTPSTRTWSDAVIMSESNCRDRPLLHSNDWLYVEPAQRSSVLSGFSLRRFTDIQWLTSKRHRSGRATVAAVSVRKQCRCNCVNVYIMFLRNICLMLRMSITVQNCFWPATCGRDLTGMSCRVLSQSTCSPRRHIL